VNRAVETGAEIAGGAGSGPPLRPPAWTSLRATWGEEGAKGALIAFASTVVVLGVIVWAVLSSDTWDSVRRQYFSVDDFRTVWPDIVEGFKLDLQMFAVAEIAILVLSLLLAVLRSLRGPAFFPLRVLTIVYIDLFRGLPLLLVILLLGFGVPALQLRGVPNGAMFWGVTALVLSYCAYTAEVYRAGIESVHESQRSAARSIGLTQWQALRYAVLPQAVRNVIPALLNGLVSLQKDVALVSILGVREAVRVADVYKGRTFNYTGYVAAAVLFLLVSVPVARFADWYTRRERLRRGQTAL
jgi:polar amino acid transport system permease protein